jgi:hypothetical protein
MMKNFCLEKAELYHINIIHYKYMINKFKKFYYKNQHLKSLKVFNSIIIKLKSCTIIYLTIIYTSYYKYNNLRKKYVYAGFNKI